jgi:hypothetical protein
LSSGVFRAGLNCENAQIIGYLCTIATGEFGHFRKPLEEAMDKISKSEKISNYPTKSKSAIRVKKTARSSIKPEKKIPCKITIKQLKETTPPPVITTAEPRQTVNQDIPPLEKKLVDSFSGEDELEDIGNRTSSDGESQNESSISLGKTLASEQNASGQSLSSDQNLSSKSLSLEPSGSSETPLPVKNLTPPKAKRFSQSVEKVSPNPKIKVLKAMLQSLEEGSVSPLSSHESKAISPLVTPLSPILKSNSCLGLLPIPMKPESSESTDYSSSKYYRRIMIDEGDGSKSAAEMELESIESKLFAESIADCNVESVSEASQSMIKSASQTLMMESGSGMTSPNFSAVFPRRSATLTPRPVLPAAFVPRKSPLSIVSTMNSSPENPKEIDFGYLETSSEDEILTEDDERDDDQESVDLDLRRRKRDAEDENTTVESGDDQGLSMRI